MTKSIPKGKIAGSRVYAIQNTAIHAARAELEKMGVIEAGRSMEMCRYLAGKINLGIESISSLSLKQREQLIDMLIEMGATVRNPHVYTSDLSYDNAVKSGRVVGFSTPKETQLRMVDALAAQVVWRQHDGYLRFCYKVIKAPRPRNSREVTTLKLALQSLLDQKSPADAKTSVDSASDSGLSSVR
mgnify:FL=1